MISKTLTVLVVSLVLAGCSNSGVGTAGGSGGGTAGGTGGGAGGGSSTCLLGDGGSACGVGRTCCNNACVNTANNPKNCGACGTECSGATPYCDGTCQSVPCSLDGGTCGAMACCGSNCCGAGQLCCKTEGPLAGPPTCFSPTAAEPTCPQGCAPLCASDRNIKRQIVAADEQAVLDAVSTMPISSWSYQSGDEKVRHLGPMAQDFHAAFGLGTTDLGYDPVDAHGVELAAIKALNARVRELEDRLMTLEAQRAETHPKRK